LHGLGIGNPVHGAVIRDAADEIDIEHRLGPGPVTEVWSRQDRHLIGKCVPQAKLVQDIRIHVARSAITRSLLAIASIIPI